MSPIAYTNGSITIYWSAILVVLGILACFFLTYALFTSHGGRGDTMWIFLVAGTILSVLFSRFIHWYCHSEQYAGFWRAMTDYSTGSYCIPGVLLGGFLAALICRVCGLTRNMSRMLDCVAPGAALGLALIRLSALYNSSCRSKIAVTTPFLRRLPFASPINSNSEDYRFATFFAGFLLLMVLCIYLLRFFYKRRRYPMKGDMPRDGHVAMMFLLWYSAIELILDSTRYDSSFVRSNGFVSLVQIVSAICLVAVFVIYSVRSVKVNGLRVSHWLTWLGFLLCVAVVGVTEYLVQRHGNWYLGCYAAMGTACFLLGYLSHRMYLSVCEDRRGRRAPAK